MNDRPQPTDPMGRLIWILLLLAALAAVGYGIHLIVNRGSRQIGPFLIGLGLIFVPIAAISMLGAIIVIGTGIYCFTAGATLYGIVFTLLGLVTLADRSKELAFSRRSGDDRAA